jgi:membrane protease YdiL (CAAX protease family)
MQIRPILMILVFVGLLIHYLIFRRQEDIPVGKSSHRKREIWEVIALFSIIFLGNSIINYFAYCVKHPEELFVAFLFAIKFFLTIGLLLFFVFKVEKRTPAELGFRKPTHPVIWLSGIGLFILWTIALLFGLSFLQFSNFLDISFIDKCFGVPIYIEVIFRGFFQTNLERSLGTNKGFWVAVILSTVYHIPIYFWGKGVYFEIFTVGENFARLAASFFMSLFFCNVYRKTRSLIAVIAISFFAN